MNLEKLKSFFTQLFTELNAEDSIYILLFLLGAFLIGLLFGALSRGRKIKRLKKMVKERDNDLITVRAENGAFKEQLEVKEERLQELSHDYEEARGNLKQLEEERGHLHTQLQSANAEIVSAQHAAQEAQSSLQLIKSEGNQNSQKIDDLNETILDLQLKNERLREQLNAEADAGTTTSDTSPELLASYAGTSDRISILEDKLAGLENENVTLRSQLTDIKGTVPVVTGDLGLSSIKSRLEQLERENNRLQKDLSSLKEHKDSTTTTSTVSNTTTTAIDDQNPEERRAKARGALNSLYGGRINRETGANKDNLKLINGIGPFIENKLNDIGIYTYEQICQFDDEIIDHVTAAIQFFPGRIKRDDWVGQSKKLMAQP